ncbi:MAG TPA: oxidoreductase [Terracidiphilus sp.]|jgi:NAD(P)-dependent dehydrogenase (short-subunit alcohol dehydrogenase family)|nr:oxidoreductase [Terracidiphilus sp.]
MTEKSKPRGWTADLIPSQEGRRVMITGGNSGIGYETALELARRGAEVVLPARTPAKANGALERIRREVPGAKLHGGTLDLASLGSVRAYAAEFAVRFPGASIDVLINNAGVMAVPTRELTVDGYERQFATNYLGPFLLTALLYGQIKQKAGSRIVIVSSSASKMGKIEFDNLQGERRYIPMWGAYAQSKLADSVFAVELQRRLAAAGSKVIAAAAHPGYAVTNLQTSGPGESGGGLVQRLAMVLLKPIASQDAAHGALPTLFAAAAPGVVPGGYYGPDRMMELKGYPVPVAVAKAARDAAMGERLWSETEKLVGTRFEIGRVG